MNFPNYLKIKKISHESNRKIKRKIINQIESILKKMTEKKKKLFVTRQTKNNPRKVKKEIKEKDKISKINKRNI